MNKFIQIALAIYLAPFGAVAAQANDATYYKMEFYPSRYEEPIYDVLIELNLEMTHVFKDECSGVWRNLHCKRFVIVKVQDEADKGQLDYALSSPVVKNVTTSDKATALRAGGVGVMRALYIPLTTATSGLIRAEFDSGLLVSVFKDVFVEIYENNSDRYQGFCDRSSRNLEYEETRVTGLLSLLSKFINPPVRQTPVGQPVVGVGSFKKSKREIKITVSWLHDRHLIGDNQRKSFFIDYAFKMPVIGEGIQTSESVLSGEGEVAFGQRGSSVKRIAVLLRGREFLVPNGEHNYCGIKPETTIATSSEAVELHFSGTVDKQIRDLIVEKAKELFSDDRIEQAQLKKYDVADQAY